MKIGADDDLSTMFPPKSYLQKGLDIQAGTALVVIVAKPVISNVTYLSSRVACQLRCCLVVHVAPEKLPMVRTTNKVGQRKTGMRSQQTRATPKQWNAMRMKLGTSVPDESIVDLVANYGDDVEGAARVYYGPGYTGR